MVIDLDYTDPETGDGFMRENEDPIDTFSLKNFDFLLFWLLLYFFDPRV